MATAFSALTRTGTTGSLKQGNFLVSISRLNFLKTIRNVYPESYLENVENSKTRSVINVGENEFSLDITVTYDIPRGLVSITDYQNL